MRSTELPCASPIARRPSRSASGRNGASAAISSAPTEGMLTAVVTAPPVSAATICSALWKPGAVGRLGRRGAQVRRHDDVGVAAGTAGSR